MAGGFRLSRSDRSESVWRGNGGERPHESETESPRVGSGCSGRPILVRLDRGRLWRMDSDARSALDPPVRSRQRSFSGALPHLAAADRRWDARRRHRTSYPPPWRAATVSEPGTAPDECLSSRAVPVPTFPYLQVSASSCSYGVSSRASERDWTMLLASAAN